ncbi:MAG TPA: pyrroline-5-carboxylate reductase [Caulobacteraceae bacterium]|jgi:pyrroline-5-carboxylate reductase|nr:pyrroline-5-carboxylate reductase [Caulobacteraceae bacterium]
MGGSETPILLVGAGHMGGALIAGWRRAAAMSPRDLLIRDPSPGEAARVAAAAGAVLNGPDEGLMAARTVILGVKPQVWRGIVADLAPHLGPDAVIISIMAGVKSADISEVLPGRPVARVMPTTAAAVGEGAASVWSADSEARSRARTLFGSLGVVVDLDEEAQIHAATAASGSAPAYVYALVEALEAAGVSAGLAPEAARSLSRAAVTGAAALMRTTGEEAAVLRRQVTSPAGTTDAALRVLIGEGDLQGLVQRAVLAAAQRSRELGGEG